METLILSDITDFRHRYIWWISDDHIEPASVDNDVIEFGIPVKRLVQSLPFPEGVGVFDVNRIGDAREGFVELDIEGVKFLSKVLLAFLGVGRVAAIELKGPKPGKDGGYVGRPALDLLEFVFVETETIRRDC